MTGVMARGARLGTIVAMVAASLVVGAAPSHAALTLQVTTTADVIDPGDGELSLREAVLEVDGAGGLGHVITLPAGTFLLTNGALPVTTVTADTLGVTVVGAGTAATVLDGVGSYRVFDVFEARLALEDLTVANGAASGSAAHGGGVMLRGDFPWFSADRVRFAGNVVTASDPGHTPRGAALATAPGAAMAGLVALTDTVFEDNLAVHGAGTVEGAVVNVDADHVRLRRTRFDGNELQGGGSAMVRLHGFQGIRVEESSFVRSQRPNTPSGEEVVLHAIGGLHVSNVTISALRSSGLELDAGGHAVLPAPPRLVEHLTVVTPHTALTGQNSANDVVVRNTILAGATSCSLQAGTQVVSGGGNVRTPMQAPPNDCDLDAPTDVEVPTIFDVGLRPLDTSEGVVVAPLEPGSPALDVGVASDSTADARGLPRVTGAAPDAGAYEHQAPSPVDDEAAGQVGETVVVDVLDDDLTGDAPLDPSSLTATAPAGVATQVADGQLSLTATAAGSVTVGYEVCQQEFVTSCGQGQVVLEAVASPDPDPTPDPDPDPDPTPDPDPGPVPVFDDGVSRLWGPDRFETAAAVSRAGFAPGVEVAFVATGRGFPDALAGGPLAAELGAPILLTDGEVLPQATATELARLGPGTVVALGGAGVVPDAVLEAAVAAAGGAGMDRVWGPDRYATAAAIAGRLGESSTVFLSTGVAFPDALAAGPVTGGAPILLTDPHGLPEATAQALAALAPDRVVAIGGPSAVAESVLSAAGAAAGGAVTDRVAGGTRFDTATAIAGLAGSGEVVFVATGGNFPDALAAAPVAAAVGGGLVLTGQDVLPQATIEHLQATGPGRVVVLGGPGAISDVVVDQLAALVPDG